MFKKLFTINYNNKIFLILVDTNHRKTFLEVLSSGKYAYPTIEDFKFLNKIYNEKDPLISYVKKYNYDEKVKYKDKTIDLRTAISLGILVISPFVIIPQVNALSRNYSESQIYYSSKFENEITKDDVIKAINSNKNLGEREKTIALKVLDDMLELDPDMNLRVFYENIMSLRIEYVSYDSLHEETHQYIAGYYDGKNNYIKVVDDADDFVIAHEIIHCSHNLIRRIGLDSVIICDFEGKFLEEAMTNKIAGISYSYNYSYYLEGLILDYFIYNTDKFDYHIYNECGVIALIDELKEKYKDVDIDYIIDFFQTNTDTAINFGNHNMVLSTEDDVLNELFKIAIANINTDDLFESFREFMKLTDNNEDVRKKYFELYIEALEKQGYINENSVYIIRNMNHLVLINDNVYLSSKNIYLDYDGTEKELDGSYILIPTDNDFKEDLIIGISNNRDVYSKEFVLDLLFSNVFYDDNMLDFIASMSKEEQEIFLNKIFDIIVANNNDYSDLNRLYTAFTRLFRNNTKLDYTYMNSFYDRFSKALMEKGNFTEEESEVFNSISAIVEYNGQYYLSTMKFSDTNISRIYNYFDKNNWLTKCTIIAHAPISIECIGADGKKFMLEIDDQIFNYYSFSEGSNEELMKYFYNIKGSNKFSKENIDGYIDYLNISESSKYKNAFTFSDGRTIYNGEINENILLQIGKNKDGRLVYRILNNGEELYKSGEIEGNSATIPYMTYLKCCESLPGNYLDEILREDVIANTLKDMMDIVPEVNSRIVWHEVVETKYYTLENGICESEEYTNVVPEIVTDFIEPPKLIMEGQEGYIRKTYIIQDIDFKVYIYLIDGTRVEITDLLNVYLPEVEVYTAYFEDCLKFFDIKPDSNNTYHLTRDEIVEIAANYINITLSKEEENRK